MPRAAANYGECLGCWPNARVAVIFLCDRHIKLRKNMSLLIIKFLCWVLKICRLLKKEIPSS